MPANTFGEKFRVTTFGESHGVAVGVVIDGVPPKLKISVDEIQKELDKRKPGQSKITTARTEDDKVEILSGIFEGKTTGTPICLIVRNKDQRSEDYEDLKDILRPGHASFTYLAKYGIYDYRGGGRASGRETIGRVAAGAIAKKILSKQKIEIIGYTKAIAEIQAQKIDYTQIEKNPVRCPDSIAAKKMEKRILEIMKAGDSVGGIVEVVIRGCPAGLGEPVFDKLDAALAKAMMSIPAVKGFEIGSGFKSARMHGSEHNDEFYFDNKTSKIRTRTNFAGGVLGGISTGEDIVFRIAVKPTSSISIYQNTLDIAGNKRNIKLKGRHDPCICPRIVPVAEAMAAIVLVDFIILKTYRTQT
ncbi:MAG: chorismate synthase [Bacteroidota bacterium]|nr:chorismate synthase [Bacteroidota bacterium]